MKKIQPRVVKGSRDFLPEQVSRRRYLLDSIREVFGRYGFQEIETPAMEMLETLTGKYGEEGDKLLFRILNSGDFLEKADENLLRSRDSKGLAATITEKGLRYDLTVPLARYVVQHQNELVFPFRRFHIGPVWRADRPQRGRYREFYQCDADIIGSRSVLDESELTRILLDVFEELRIRVQVGINHRKILEAIVGKAGLSGHYKEVLVAVDKLDKAGKNAVSDELRGHGLAGDAIETLFMLFEAADLGELAIKLGGASVEGALAIRELSDIIALSGDKDVKFSPSLARGLDYYTGTIWEVKALDVAMGTIAAGGRYDDLTEMFGGKDMSGVGISFGVERIYDILEETGSFPAHISTTTRVLIINFDERSSREGWSLVNDLRARKVASELYPSPAKLKKQMSYADKKNIPFVIFIGEEEAASGNVTVKEMATGEQTTISRKDIGKLAALLSGNG